MHLKKMGSSGVLYLVTVASLMIQYCTIDGSFKEQLKND